MDVLSHTGSADFGRSWLVLYFSEKKCVFGSSLFFLFVLRVSAALKVRDSSFRSLELEKKERPENCPRWTLQDWIKATKWRKRTSFFEELSFSSCNAPGLFVKNSVSCKIFRWPGSAIQFFFPIFDMKFHQIFSAAFASRCIEKNLSIYMFERMCDFFPLQLEQPHGKVLQF